MSSLRVAGPAADDAELENDQMIAPAHASDIADFASRRHARIYLASIRVSCVRLNRHVHNLAQGRNAGK